MIAATRKFISCDSRHYTAKACAYTHASIVCGGMLASVNSVKKKLMAQNVSNNIITALRDGIR